MPQTFSIVDSPLQHFKVQSIADINTMNSKKNSLKTNLLYLSYYILAVSALAYSLFYILKLTPIADDYWYAALIRDYGVFGGTEWFMINHSGLLFKEFIILIMFLPIAYLPIGIGSGIVYIFIALCFILFVTFILKTFSKQFWLTLEFRNKLLLWILIGVTYFTSNAVIYKNTKLEITNISNNQNYDLTFWISAQSYYIFFALLFSAWFIYNQLYIKNIKIANLSILLFGLAIGTTNYALAGTFILGMIIWNIIFKFKKEMVFNYKLKYVYKSIIYIVLGVCVSFAFPSSFKRAASLSSYTGDKLSASYSVIISSLKTYLSDLTSVSLILSFIAFAIFSALFFGQYKNLSHILNKIGFVFFIISVLSVMSATVVDITMLYLPWHYIFAVVFLKIASIIFGVSLGMLISTRLNTIFKKVIASVIIIASIYIPLVANADTITSRAECWVTKNCPIGNAMDIESLWFYKYWLSFEKHQDIPHRFSPLDDSNAEAIR